MHDRVVHEQRPQAQGDDLRLTVETLAARSCRTPDYQGENRALVALASELAESPGTVLEKLAELVIELCRADSAGISVLGADETGAEIFEWPAVAGAWTSYVGGTMPRDASPCGVVIDLDACLLLEEPALRFPAAGIPSPQIAELLLAPLHVRGKTVGTVWAIIHDPQHRFDAEDMRLLTSMASFASLRIFAPSVDSFEPHISRAAAEAAFASLTERQRQVLRHIIQGQPNKTIAASLGISTRTTENHRAALMKRMGVSSVAALIQATLAV